jgi:hypothetical protein
MLLVYDIVHNLGFYFVKYLIVFFSMQVFIRSVSKTAETIVNNLPIKEQRQLCDGDTIMIGQRAFIYYSDFANIKSKGPPSVSNIPFTCFHFLATQHISLIYRHRNRKDRRVLHSKMRTEGNQRQLSLDQQKLFRNALCRTMGQLFLRVHLGFMGLRLRNSPRIQPRPWI